MSLLLVRSAGATSLVSLDFEDVATSTTTAGDARAFGALLLPLLPKGCSTGQQKLLHWLPKGGLELCGWCGICILCTCPDGTHLAAPSSSDSSTCCCILLVPAFTAAGVVAAGFCRSSRPRHLLDMQATRPYTGSGALLTSCYMDRACLVRAALTSQASCVGHKEQGPGSKCCCLMLRENGVTILC